MTWVRSFTCTECRCLGAVIVGHLMVVHYYETRIHDEDTEIRRSVTPL